MAKRERKTSPRKPHKKPLRATKANSRATAENKPGITATKEIPATPSNKVGWPHNRNVANALKKSLEIARTPQSRNNVKTIVMLSGGLDSVALLATVLAETNHHVHAHHIEIRNFENRAEIENRVTPTIVEYCRELYRDFEYSSSVNEFNVGMGGGTDLQLALFVAGRLAISLGGNIDIVYTGHIFSPYSDLSEGSAIFNAVFLHRKFKPEWLWPLSKLTAPASQSKADIYESIPKELADMTWSCRKPVATGDGFEPCGTCHACKTRQKMAANLATRGHN